MNDTKDLPAYTDAELASLKPAELIDLLIQDCDCAPRNLIDECVRRGDEISAYLTILHEDDFLWDLNADDGVWWLRLHAAMILGQISSEQAGLLLVELMQRMSLEDDDIQDWLDGYWPAFFKNKPQSVIPALRELSVDKHRDWYMRANAIEVVTATSAWQGGEVLEAALEWLAGIANDEEEESEICLTAGSMLLYFPRPQYRQLLEDLADLQAGFDIHFDRQSIRQAYDGQYFSPEWERFNDPLEFYEPDAIAKRQLRWRAADIREEKRLSLRDEQGFLVDSRYEPFVLPETYVRPEPKIGRNDPCPCGSGKKYKKCCLGK